MSETLFSPQLQSRNGQLQDQLSVLQKEIASLRTDNVVMKNSLNELLALLEVIYSNQNIHSYPAETRDRLSRVIIETKMLLNVN